VLPRAVACTMRRLLMHAASALQSYGGHHGDLDVHGPSLDWHAAREQVQGRRCGVKQLGCAAGVEEVSAFNTTVQDLRHSYREGQGLAYLHNIQDYETTLQELQEYPEQLAAFQEYAQDPLLMREMWHAMFLSGMLPLEQFDRPIVESHAAGTPIFCVDMPQHQVEQLAGCGPQQVSSCAGVVQSMRVWQLTPHFKRVQLQLGSILQGYAAFPC
jgi:hypothetical protein